MKEIRLCYECGHIMAPEERRCARCGAEKVEEPVDSADWRPGDLDGEEYRTNEEAVDKDSGDKEVGDHQKRFASIVRAACDQLEELVERRGAEQLEHMAERLALIEQELDIFLGEAGETEGIPRGDEKKVRSENRD